MIGEETDARDLAEQLERAGFRAERGGSWRRASLAANPRGDLRTAWRSTRSSTCGPSREARTAFGPAHQEPRPENANSQCSARAARVHQGPLSRPRVRSTHRLTLATGNREPDLTVTARSQPSNVVPWPDPAALATITPRHPPDERVRGGMGLLQIERLPEIVAWKKDITRAVIPGCLMRHAGIER